MVSLPLLLVLVPISSLLCLSPLTIAYSGAFVTEPLVGTTFFSLVAIAVFGVQASFLSKIHRSGVVPSFVAGKP